MNDLSNRGPLGLKGDKPPKSPARGLRKSKAGREGGEKRHPLRENAQGRLCTLRLPGCRGAAEYTVLAHYRRYGWAGEAQKPNDLLGCFACDHCHALQEAHKVSADDMLRAMGETLMIQQATGVIKIDASAVGSPQEIDF